MTFLTQRKIQKSWDCDSHELRLVLRLPQGYRFTGMDVHCGRVSLEYCSLENPETPLRDCIDLQVPVRGSEAVHALREDCGEEVLNIWVPRHHVTVPGLDGAARHTASSLRSLEWGQVAS